MRAYGRVVGANGDDLIASKADHVIRVPARLPLISPIISVIPAHLLAYHIAVRRGPAAQLANSVTVE